MLANTPFMARAQARRSWAGFRPKALLGMRWASGSIWSSTGLMAGSTMELKDPARIEEVGRDMIIEAAPTVSGPRPADRNIAANAAEDDGV